LRRIPLSICLVFAASLVRAVEIRPLMEAALVDVSAGVHTPPSREALSGAVLIPVALAGVAFGVRVSDHVGAALGTALLSGNVVADISYLPVRASLLYDFSPGQQWRKAFAHVTATYVHSGQSGWNGSQFAPYVRLGAGAAYTFYAVTPHAELGYDTHWGFLTATAGVAVGGVHVFR